MADMSGQIALVTSGIRGIGVSDGATTPRPRSGPGPGRAALLL